jgi:hypothetical protein
MNPDGTELEDYAVGGGPYLQYRLPNRTPQGKVGKANYTARVLELKEHIQFVQQKIALLTRACLLEWGTQVFDCLVLECIN